MPASTPSSRDLHPETGARYVFRRLAGAPAPAYEVTVHAAGGATHRARVTWTDGVDAALDPPLADPALHDQVVKLARALRADLPERLTRWR